MENEKSGGSSIISNVLWKMAEQCLAQVVSLVVSVVLARLLLPDDYGIIAMVIVFITVANAFVTSGIPTALIQKKDTDAVDFSSVFFFNIGLAVVLYAILFCCAPLIAQFYEAPILKPVVRVMGLNLLPGALNSVQSAYVSRNMMFKKYFLSTLSGTLGSGVVGILLAYSGAGVWALVFQNLMNVTINAVVLFFTIDWRPIRAFSWKRVSALVKFGWKILFEGISNTVAGQISNLVIGKVYTSGDLGFYTKAQQFPNIVSTNFSNAVSAVLLPAISKEQDDEKRVELLLRKSVRLASFVVFPMLTGLALVAEPLIRLLMTEKWLGCVPYMQIYCLACAMTVGMIPRHQALNGTGRSDVFMYEHMFARILGFILLFAVYKISVMAVAWSSIFSGIAMVLTVMFTSKRFNGYGYWDQIRDVIPSIAGCLIMGICVYPLSFLPMPDIAMLALQITVGVAAYVLYGIVFKLEETQLILGFLSRFLKKK